MNTEIIVTVTAGIVLFAVVSKRVEQSVLTAPMVFALFGVVLGPLVLDIAHIDLDHGFVHVLAEVTLILVLFSDAARIDLRRLRREHDLPVRLLIVGMPLTIALGFGLAALLFSDLSLGACAVLAIILAPTDAALGQAVVSSPIVPARIRQSLNVESGLNDGIALPALLFMLCMAGAAGNLTLQSDGTALFWARFAAAQLLLGPLAGVIVALAGAHALRWATDHDWITKAFEDIAMLALALLAFAGAEVIGGNGFIAAFCAGLTVGYASGGICRCVYEFAEVEGQLLSLLVFMVFGAVMVPMLAGHVTWQMGVYAVASLTIVRMVPVAIALVGRKLQPETVLFLGWFGPRGLASLLFALLVAEQFQLEGAELILEIVLLTVLLSIFLHGISANPAARWYAARAAQFPDAGQAAAPEHHAVSDLPVRIPHRG